MSYLLTRPPFLLASSPGSSSFHETRLLSYLRVEGGLGMRLGLMEPFLNIVGRFNFTEAKSHEVCTVLLNKRLFLKNQTALAIKPSIWPSNTLKTVDLIYCLSLLVAWMVRFWFKSLQSLIAYAYITARTR